MRALVLAIALCFGVIFCGETGKAQDQEPEPQQSTINCKDLEACKVIDIWNEFANSFLQSHNTATRIVENFKHNPPGWGVAYDRQVATDQLIAELENQIKLLKKLKQADKKSFMPKKLSGVASQVFEYLCSMETAHGLKEVKIAIQQFNKESKKMSRTPTPRKMKITRELAQKLCIAQDWLCPRCGLLIESLKDVDCDHVEAVVHGGADTEENLQAYHKGCNRSKGGKTIYQESKASGRLYGEILSGVKNDGR